MYLARLSTEQKNLFLDLCIHGANSNDDFAADEKEIVNAYCTEMQIPIRYIAENDLDECLDKLVKISTKEELRAILIEIAALILADEICDEKEKIFMEKFIWQAGITETEYDHVMEMLSDLSGLYKEMNTFVAGT